MEQPDTTTDASMSADALYREDIITDRKVGTIRRLSPVTAEGEPDNSRPIEYIGQAQILTPMGPVPLSFEIKADSLKEAVEKFSAEAKVALDRAARELQEMRREQASSIVVPDAGTAASLGKGPGGLGGGGIIK